MANPGPLGPNASALTTMPLSLNNVRINLFGIECGGYVVQGNQQNRAMMLNSKVVDYINYILRASEFKNCDTEKVNSHTHILSLRFKYNS